MTCCAMAAHIENEEVFLLLKEALVTLDPLVANTLENYWR